MFAADQTLQIRRFLTHRNAFLADAVHAAIPQAAQLVAALERAEAAQTAAKRTSVDADAQVDQLIEEMVAAITAGAEFPNVDADLVRLAQEREHANLAAEMHTRVAAAVGSEAASALNDTSRADVMLKHLNGRLQQIVAEARTLPLAGASSAEEAIERGVGAPWKTFQQLRSDSFFIRQAQADIMSKLHEQHQQHRHTFGYFENFTDLDSGWWSKSRSEEVRRDEESPLSPWPAALPEKFLWSVQHPEAQVWVPTLPQLQQAVSTATGAARLRREAENEGLSLAVLAQDRGLTENGMLRFGRG